MTGRLAGLRVSLGRLRTDPGIHWLAQLIALAMGLALASQHWLGLIVGGALVGILALSLRRALLAGLGFGCLVTVIWILGFWRDGTLEKVLAMGEIAAIAVLIGLLAPVLGSLVRGIV